MAVLACKLVSFLAACTSRLHLEPTCVSLLLIVIVEHFWLHLVACTYGVMPSRPTAVGVVQLRLLTVFYPRCLVRSTSIALLSAGACILPRSLPIFSFLLRFSSPPARSPTTIRCLVPTHRMLSAFACSRTPGLTPMGCDCLCGVVHALTPSCWSCSLQVAYCILSALSCLIYKHSPGSVSLPVRVFSQSLPIFSFPLRSGFFRRRRAPPLRPRTSCVLIVCCPPSPVRV